MKKIKIGLAICSLALSPVTLGGQALAAGNASFSVSGSGNYPIGSTISSTVYENSPTEPVNVVQADIVYDPYQLQLLNIDTSQSSFPGSLSGSGSGGSIKIIRYSMTPITGQATIATLNFKVLADSGSGNLSFASSSHIISSGQDVWDKNTSGASFNFTPPLAPPTASSTAPIASAAKPVVPQTAAETDKPTDSVLTNTSKLPRRSASTSVYTDNSRNWWIFIGLCGLVILGLLARLFNVHKRIGAKSPHLFIAKAIKKAV